jgi:hypothetical protein
MVMGILTFMRQGLLPASAMTSTGEALAIFILEASHLKRGTDLPDEVTNAAQRWMLNSTASGQCDEASL